MNHQVTVSELLSNILDNVGYSRDDRDRKVRTSIESEVLQNMAHALHKYGLGYPNRRFQLRWYMFGSRGEGSTGPGLQSDIDSLFQDDVFNVVTDLTDCLPDKVNYLMLLEDFTHPGYVLLQPIDILPDCTPVPRVVTKMILPKVYLLNRCVLTNTHIHGFGHVSGPAVSRRTNLKNCSEDRVVAFRCSRWPQGEYEWFQRRRNFGWPTANQIQSTRDYGCFATSVGHPHSSKKHQEFRLSFTLAERDLTRSFEETAMKVYILLKMIKKTFIEPIVGDAFSSYHCKVCMLWMRERTPHELWRNDNLLYCLILCIRQLREWATAGVCPDYFIVKNNIYDRKIVGTIRSELVKIINYLLSSDCRFLLEIKCCHLGQFLTNRISGFYIHYMSNLSLIIDEINIDYTVTITRACICRHYIFEHIQQYYTMLVNYLQIMMYAWKRSSDVMQYPLKYAMMVLCSQLGFHIATVCKENAHHLSHEEVKYLVALASHFLSFGINSDATSVRLKLCGLGIELGDYKLTEDCLQNIGNYRMRYMYSATVDEKHNLTIHKYPNERLRTKRYSTEELMQTQVSFSVVYMPSEKAITPTPLRMEMFRSIGAPPQLKITAQDSWYDCGWYDWGVVDSLICLYFFQYLNFYRQGKERHRKVVMDNMIHVIRTEPRILHRDTALNLLGYSFMQENQLTNAFTCFTKSLKFRPYHNAAKFYLAVLFKRVLASHRNTCILLMKVH